MKIIEKEDRKKRRNASYNRDNIHENSVMNENATPIHDYSVINESTKDLFKNIKQYPQ